jgi:hypothetical protein
MDECLKFKFDLKANRRRCAQDTFEDDLDSDLICLCSIERAKMASNTRKKAEFGLSNVSTVSQCQKESESEKRGMSRRRSNGIKKEVAVTMKVI